METHDLNYYGIEFCVTGYYDNPDETTGYKGGFLLEKIYLAGKDITELLRDSIVDDIAESILNENY